VVLASEWKKWSKLRKSAPKPSIKKQKKNEKKKKEGGSATLTRTSVHAPAHQKKKGKQGV
jgi:hypothetical protein